MSKPRLVAEDHASQDRITIRRRGQRGQEQRVRGQTKNVLNIPKQQTPVRPTKKKVEKSNKREKLTATVAAADKETQISVKDRNLFMFDQEVGYS